MSTYRVPRDLQGRRDLFYALHGQKVTITQRLPGGTRLEHTGTVITVAVADHGTTSDFVVIDKNGPGYFPHAYSIAQLVRVVQVEEDDDTPTEENTT